jgi:hypothetical protein
MDKGERSRVGDVDYRSAENPLIADFGPWPSGRNRPEEGEGEPGCGSRSRAKAIRVNHWLEVGSGCEDVMAGSVRGGGSVR